MPPTESITLLVPCYNASRYLPRLIESVRALTRPFDAILCYDDGSKDDTVAVARQLGLNIITGHHNAGVSVARNRLAAAATTEWIHFHDADDIILPQFLARLAPACDSNHDVVTCDADWVNEVTCATIIAWRYNPLALIHDPLSHLLENAMGLNCSIIRRSLWATVGGCDEKLGMWEDADVHIRLANAHARFAHVSEVHTHSLRHDDSFSHDYLKSWTYRLTALESYATRFPPRVHPVIADQAEIAARSLCQLGGFTPARRALALNHSLGGRAPTSHHPVIRALRRLAGPWTALRVQQLLRSVR